MNIRYEIASNIFKSIIQCIYFQRYVNETNPFPVFINNLTELQKGCKFVLLIDEHLSIHIKVTSFIETDYFTHVEYLAYTTIPKSFQFKFSTSIHYINRNSCLVVTENVFPFSAAKSQSTLHLERRKRRGTYMQIEKKLKQRYHRHFQIEQITIKVKSVLLWELLLNMKTFHKILHATLNCEDVIYKGKILENEMHVLFTVNIGKSNSKITVQGKVLKCVKDAKESELVLQLFENKEGNIIDQQIQFLIIEYHSICEMYMVNTFSVEQRECDLDKLGKIKRKLMEKYKSIIENYVNSN